MQAAFQTIGWATTAESESMEDFATYMAVQQLRIQLAKQQRFLLQDTPQHQHHERDKQRHQQHEHQRQNRLQHRQQRQHSSRNLNASC